MNDLFGLIGAFAIGFLVCYLIFGMRKAPAPIVETVVVSERVPFDTCFAVAVDSMEIYRIVRRGLYQHRKLEISAPEPDSSGLKGDTTETVYRQSVNIRDSLFDVTVGLYVKDTTCLLASDVSYRLDTLEIMRLFTVTDSFPIYIEPIIVEKKIPVPEEFRAIGVTGGAGVFYDPFGNPFVDAGLYYQDRRSRIYALSAATNKSLHFKFSIPLWKR